MNRVRFVDRSQTEFFRVLKSRINGYFTDNNIPKTADYRMVLKTIILIGSYLGVYAILFTMPMNWPLLILLGIIGGFFYSGIGMSVMHDANHGAYSNSAFWNRLLGGSIYLLGANRYNWKQKHNVKHHTFTNIEGMDDDLDNGGLVRLSDEQPMHKAHRFQYIYAWFLYSLITIAWVTNKDFVQLKTLKKSGFGPKTDKAMRIEYSKIIIGKIFYYSYAFVLPLIITDLSIWQLLVFHLALHFTSGMILSIIFQLAHIVEPIDYPVPNDKGHIENSWAIHQLATTADFSRNSRFLNWYCGGLNYQVEHHLFPNICHIHYNKLSYIVEETAHEYGVPYNGLGTFTQAVASHYRQLKRLSKPDSVAVKKDVDKDKKEPVLV
jgi:linoleoyl-CoA desaturase